MTRLLVLGNSHSGALRMAKDAFRTRHPEIDATFFAAPGAQFLRGRTGPDGVWRPHMPDENARSVIATINGATECDLAGYDAILVVGHRFAPKLLAELLMEHEVIGMPRRAPASVERRISRGFLGQAADAVIEAAAAVAERRLGTQHPFVLTDAPHPSDQVGSREDDYGRLMETLQTHPAGAELMADWTARVTAAVTKRGWGFLPQPASTLSGPAATRAGFATGAATGDGDRLDHVDHRHMNGEFGLAVLEAWAAYHAARTLEPARDPAPDASADRGIVTM